MAKGGKVLLLSMASDEVSELQPPTGLLFVPPMIFGYGEPRWNNVDRRKPKN
jgi:hypothetical protein